MLTCGGHQSAYGGNVSFLHRLLRPVALVAVLASLVVFVGSDDGAAQALPRVFVSEIHYHPQQVGTAFPDFDDREDTEFIELVNLEPTAVEVGGWCLNDGVDFCFAPGTALAPQNPVVIARDAAQFESIHGVAPDGVYEGRLSNSGEQVRLVDDLGAVVTAVVWQTTNPWPLSPDGNGPSLELFAAAGANSDPSNWRASAEVDGTPGMVPSLSGQPQPLVLSYAAPAPAVSGQPISLSASATNTTSMSVIWNVDFGPSTTTDMSAGAGGFSALLPALSTGQILRFRFEATGPGGTVASPLPSDSVDWFATAVPTDPLSAVPTFDLHLSDAVWDSVETLNCPDAGCDGVVVVHDGRIWTGVTIRRAGFTSLTQAKGSYRLDFPEGRPFEASWLTESSDELALDMGFPNHDLLREQLSWDIMADMGFPAIETQHTRLTRNGEFHGLYLIRDEQDGDWRSRNGFDNGAFYKVNSARDTPATFGFAGVFDKKEALGEPDTDIIALRGCLDQTGDALRSCLLDQVDIPNVVHELAATMVVLQIDQREFNYFVYRDDTENGLWRLLPDDLDRTWGVGGVTNVGNPLQSSLTWFERCVGLTSVPANEICRAVMSVPEFEEMVNRRVRTLVDEHLSDPKWPAAIGQGADLIRTEWNEDENRWNRTDFSFDRAITELQQWVPTYVAHLRSGGHDGKVPAEQSAQPPLVVAEVQPDTGNGFAYALLTNPSTSESVDISGWEFDGLGIVADGTVVLPGATVAVTNNDGAFQAAKPGFNGVRAFLDGTIAGATELVRRDGSVVAAFGEAASNALILNEWNAVSSTNVLSGGDPTFGQVPGNGGDWFELVVIEDQLDIRGWRLVLADSDGAGPAIRDEFVFADRSELASLEAGVIITVSEDRADDLTLSQVDGDWHINLQANTADAGNFFTADSQSNFDTNNDDWQLTIFDDQNNLVFGPAGEGVGNLSGVNSAEIGELEVDPSADVDHLTAYGDGDASTYGLPNETDGTLQDFSAIARTYRRGDVDCSGTFDLADALVVAQHAVGFRTTHPQCPLADPASQIYLPAGDLDGASGVTLRDARIMVRCSVGLPQSFCPN